MAFYRPTHFLREKPWGRGWIASQPTSEERDVKIQFLRPNYQLEHCITKRKKKEKKICYASGQNFTLFKFIFLFSREWWGLWKWVLPKEKYTASFYSNIGRIPSSCGGQLWVNSLLKPLNCGSLVCWLPAAQELFIRADRTLTRLRCGEKMVWKGIKDHVGPFHKSRQTTGSLLHSRFLCRHAMFLLLD